jgi:hypothetical protein
MQRSQRTEENPMQSTNPRYTVCALGVAAALLLLGACSRSDDGRAVSTSSAASTDQTAQAKTPPPAGDSTPKPADSDTRAASQGTEQASRSSSSQSTVGTAASGAPPYTLNGAPEGNKAPKDGEPPKK